MVHISNMRIFFNPLGLFCDSINVLENSIYASFHVTHDTIWFSYLFMLVLVEELDSPVYLEDFQEVEELDYSAYAEDFHEVEMKDELLEYDAVSCETILAFVSILFLFDITHKRIFNLSNLCNLIL